MSDPPITVLMPVRDGARFLDLAIASILRQTLSDYEFLICDDGSLDDTPRILERYAAQDARIRVISLPRIGLVAALNRGLHEARGHWIARMDADDVAWADRLRLQMAHAHAYPDTAAISGAWRVVDVHGRVRRVFHPPTEPDAIAATLRRHNCFGHPSVIFRRNAVQALGGYREAFQHAEDYDLWLRLADQHPLRGIPDIILDYREHVGQVTWVALEQRILSDLGARLAARMRDAGVVDLAVGATRIDHRLLRTAGMTEVEISAETTAMALGTAKHALAAGHGSVARTAARLLWRQTGLHPRTQVHALLLLLRAYMIQLRGT